MTHPSFIYQTYFLNTYHSQFSPLILKVEGSIFHDEVSDRLKGNCLGSKMDWVVFHPVPEENQLRGRLHHEPQLFLNLIQPHIAPQQQQILVVLQLEQQELEQLHQFFGDRLRLVVQEEQHVLGSAHFSVVVVTREFIGFLCFFGLLVVI